MTFQQIKEILYTIIILYFFYLIYLYSDIIIDAIYGVFLVDPELFFYECVFIFCLLVLYYIFFYL